jgi:hypothetical protein
MGVAGLQEEHAPAGLDEARGRHAAGGAAPTTMWSKRSVMGS